MKAFFTKKGTGARKPIDKSRIGAPTGFVHVAGNNTMAATAKLIPGVAKEVSPRAASGEPKPERKGAEASDDKVTDLPVPPAAAPARKGVGALLSWGVRTALNLRETLRGRKAKNKTKEEASLALVAGASSSANVSVSVSASSTADPPSSPGQATPPSVSISPVRRGSPAPPQLPALSFDAAARPVYHPSGAAASRAQALGILSSPGPVEQLPEPATAEEKARRRETSVYGGYLFTPAK